MYVQDQPMWLEFSQGNLGYTEVPEDYFLEAFDKASNAALAPHKLDATLAFMFETRFPQHLTEFAVIVALIGVMLKL